MASVPPAQAVDIIVFGSNYQLKISMTRLHYQINSTFPFGKSFGFTLNDPARSVRSQRRSTHGEFTLTAGGLVVRRRTKRPEGILNPRRSGFIFFVAARPVTGRTGISGRLFSFFQ
jgi:hypothetical protein